MNTDKALEMLKRQPANAEAAMKIELEKADRLIEKIIEHRANLAKKEYPHWGNVGDVKRFNELLAESINTTN